jgi:hypothetical protein
VLETPLYGKFLGENKRLLFAPTGPYYGLVRACVFLGFGGAFLGFLASPLNVALPIYNEWWIWTGVAVGCSGLLGAASMQSLVFDLREKTYRRRLGGGPFVGSSRGRLSDLDALVIIAEPNARMMQGGVTYHLVLHWKGQKEPSAVIQQETRLLPPGQPLNAGAAYLLQVGMKYAAALEVPFYDNSYFASSNPVSFLRPRI